MTENDRQSILEKLDALRVELSDLAFLLDSRGRADAADVATTTAIRLAELCEEFRPEENPFLAKNRE